MIHFIDKLEAQRMLMSPDKSGKYHGPRPEVEFDKFLLYDNPVWTAIDNTTGEAWTEEFETVEKALEWLDSHVSKEELEEEREEREKEQYQIEGAYYARVAARKVKAADERRKTQAENDRINAAVDDLFRRIEFVNKDGWQIYVNKDRGRHHLASHLKTFPFSIVVWPSESGSGGGDGGELFNMSGYIGGTVTRSWDAGTLAELASKVAMELAERLEVG